MSIFRAFQVTMLATCVFSCGCGKSAKPEAVNDVPSLPADQPPQKKSPSPTIEVDEDQGRVVRSKLSLGTGESVHVVRWKHGKLSGVVKLLDDDGKLVSHDLSVSLPPGTICTEEDGPAGWITIIRRTRPADLETDGDWKHTDVRIEGGWSASTLAENYREYDITRDNSLKQGWKVTFTPEKIGTASVSISTITGSIREWAGQRPEKTSPEGYTYRDILGAGYKESQNGLISELEFMREDLDAEDVSWLELKLEPIDNESYH